MFDTYESIFSQRASLYHNAMARWPNARASEFRAVVDPLGETKGQLVCDMPSGGGYLAKYLPAGTRYLAVEPTEEFFSSCKRDALHDAMMAPITSVPKPTASLDHLVSLAGLHHVEDLRPVLTEMCRLVQPGGKVVICDVAEGSTSGNFLNGFVHDNNPMGHEGRFFDATLPDLIDEAGLSIIDDMSIITPWRFSSRQDVGAFAMHLFGLEGPSVEEVTEVLAEQIGIREEPDGYALQWQLRRVICTVIDR